MFLSMRMVGVFWLAFLFCVPSIAQEIPKLTSQKIDGYVDVSVLKSRVKENTKAIEAIKEELRQLEQFSEKAEGGLKNSPLSVQNVVSEVEQPMPWCSTVRYPPMTGFSGLCVHCGTPLRSPSFQLSNRLENSVIPLHVNTAAAGFPIQKAYKKSSQRMPSKWTVKRDKSSVRLRAPKCRIVNGRKSCN